MTSRYSNSKVYKMVNGIDKHIYIGSTTQPLSKRLNDHKIFANTRKPLRVHNHFNRIGWETVRIRLIENVHCKNREELLQREQYYIDELQPSLNRRNAYAFICPHDKEKIKLLI